MVKFWCNCVVVLLLASNGFALPQGRGVVQQQNQVVHQEPSLDPAEVDESMNQEHAKLIENLQRLKRTLDHVKERVGKGTYGDQTNVDMKNPEGAILTVLKSLQEQGQLFSMINDMLKAGSEVQNQTGKIQSLSELQQHVHEEAAIAENTNHIAPPSHTPSASLPSKVPSLTPPVSVPTAISSSTLTSRRHKDGTASPAKHHGYDDYQYQYRDDTKDATGDDQYDYHYDGSGYDEAPAPRTTTSTTTTRRPGRRIKTRGRNDYY